MKRMKKKAKKTQKQVQVAQQLLAQPCCGPGRDPQPLWHSSLPSSQSGPGPIFSPPSFLFTTLCPSPSFLSPPGTLVQPRAGQGKLLRCCVPLLD